MPSKLPVFNIRIDETTKTKISIIAKKNGRSTNKEIEQLIKKRIQEYEAEHSEIQTPENFRGGGGYKLLVA